MRRYTACTPYRLLASCKICVKCSVAGKVFRCEVLILASRNRTKIQWQAQEVGKSYLRRGNPICDVSLIWTLFRMHEVISAIQCCRIHVIYHFNSQPAPPFPFMPCVSNFVVMSVSWDMRIHHHHTKSQDWASLVCFISSHPVLSRFDHDF
jgi:hypothetical protein